jgi:hypothetical protein
MIAVKAQKQYAMIRYMREWKHRLLSVSKRRDAPYRSGACRGWRKVKTMTWPEANRERWRLFERAK